VDAHSQQLWLEYVQAELDRIRAVTLPALDRYAFRPRSAFRSQHQLCTAHSRSPPTAGRPESGEDCYLAR